MASSRKKGIKAARWVGLLLAAAAIWFSLSGVVGVLSRPQGSFSGTEWSGMGHSAIFYDGGIAFYDGARFSYEESGGAAKGEMGDGGHIDFVMMSDDRLFCITDLALLLRD